jgi:hypothetical protein
VEHVLPVAQSSVVAQVVKQTDARHAKVPHDETGGTLQLPLPSQEPAAWAPPSTQLASPHGVVAPAKPSQLVPVMPSHDKASQGSEGASETHTGRVPWGSPAMGVQVPWKLVASQASHWPWHATLQQTPSTQKPLVHWSLALHVWPFGSWGEHAPALQYALKQSVSTVHVVLHVPVAATHRYEPKDDGAGAVRHAPKPLHMDAVGVFCAHELGLQGVPAS